jgi:hypothetical protein
MSQLASRFRAFHRAGPTGILAWPEHHHAADTDSEHLQAGSLHGEILMPAMRFYAW